LSCCTLPAPNDTEGPTLASLAGGTSASQIEFYRRLGGIVVTDGEANGWAFLQTDTALVLLLEKFPILWVGAASCKMMLIHIPQRRLLCPLLRIWDYDPSCPRMMNMLGSRLGEQSVQSLSVQTTSSVADNDVQERRWLTLFEMVSHHTCLERRILDELSGTGTVALSRFFTRLQSADRAAPRLSCKTIPMLHPDQSRLLEAVEACLQMLY
jgi:hypothetical protein